MIGDNSGRMTIFSRHSCGPVFPIPLLRTMMVSYWLFSVLLVIGCIEGQKGNESLLSVFLLARHGERYPCHSLRHPTYPKEFVKMRCQLTEIGAKQHFELGKFIRRRYSSFLKWEGFKRNYVHIRSTGTERTILSATYFGLGLNFNAEVELPILPAVFSSPKRYDYLLKMSYPCPAFNKLFKKALNSNLTRDFAEGVRVLFEDLKNLTEFSFESDSLHKYLPELWKLCESIYTWDNLERATKGESLPFSSDLASACHRALSFRQQLRFSTPAQTFLRGGPLWRHVLLTLKRQTSFGERGTPRFETEDIDDMDIPITSESRLFAYFAHDSTLTAFLSHLGVFNNILPPYASAVIVELHRLVHGELALRFFYHNASTPASSQLIALTTEMCGDEETYWCPLDVLEDRLRGKAATDMESACVTDENSPPTTVLVTSALIASLAFAYALPIGYTIRALLCLIAILLTYRFLFLIL
ncbi:Putative acid phosphatase [Echinococcus granulosus]|uniref:acid phosphatase n=2 Tax=Echinococcus granulosus TaxID=6210 RepID=W6U1B3_ECHGR|nr:Putative acid phosphatase [Echinococcus granulosus]EUB54900.1 Putative acid phosphatase [Echinococcus granulosus]